MRSRDWRLCPDDWINSDETVHKELDFTYGSESNSNTTWIGFQRTVIENFLAAWHISSESQAPHFQFRQDLDECFQECCELKCKQDCFKRRFSDPRYYEVMKEKMVKVLFIVTSTNKFITCLYLYCWLRNLKEEKDVLLWCNYSKIMMMLFTYAALFIQGFQSALQTCTN